MFYRLGENNAKTNFSTILTNNTSKIQYKSLNVGTFLLHTIEINFCNLIKSYFASLNIYVNMLSIGYKNLNIEGD